MLTGAFGALGIALRADHLAQFCGNVSGGPCLAEVTHWSALVVKYKFCRPSILLGLKWLIRHSSLENTNLDILVVSDWDHTA